MTLPDNLTIPVDVLSNEIVDVTVEFEEVPKQLFQVTLALIMGFIIGLERRRHGIKKTAQYVIICTAACFLSLISKNQSFVLTVLAYKIDPTRTSAAIITGVGFLGAGFIVKNHETGQASGFTSAALLWISATIGIGIAFGFYIVSTYVTFLVLLMANVQRFYGFLFGEPKANEPKVQ
eukprot:TRINITY_DN7121_c0_g1_i1.p1 TRINITY_DN7121_c0_g1~~TRINITY_DN7121_c0_g1_i1.p1  ORF type:complete len:178 (+),score=22.90 TRINITY_DN7121_c0_g1_i1:44-577(+)